MKKTFFFVLSCLAMTSFASNQTYLNYTVTNNSSANIYFKSTDLFDFGKLVHSGESKTITYDMPPKIIVTAIKPQSSSYTIQTDLSCDALGLPSFRQPTVINEKQKVDGVAVQTAGNVNVMIDDLPGSNSTNLVLICNIEK